MTTPLLLALVLLLSVGGGAEDQRGLLLTGRTATPFDNGDWIDPIQDYPAAARRGMESGTVAVRLFVSGTGRVAGCLVTQGPGFASLERSTCRILRARARFVAFAGRGLAVFDYRVVWDLGRLPPLPRQILRTTVN